MKQKIILTIVFGMLVSSGFLFSQAKKPTLMILPSDNWCAQRYFMTEFDNQGTKLKVPNYKQAFQEDTEIGQVISKIGGLMIERGFPLKDVEQELKAIEQRTAENNMTSSSSSGAGLSESPLDMLKNRAKADIVIQIWWKVSKAEQGKVVSFVLEAFDAYTNKRIAASSGNSSPNNADVVPVLLQNAILANIDVFASQLQKHFDDMFENGREIRLTVRKWDTWEYDLESEFEGEELRDLIYDWLTLNTVKGKFNESNSSENLISYEQVRIPLFDERDRAIDARRFTRDLQKYLKAAPFNFQVKLMTRGLGEAILVLGEK
ncbi:DUF6175 family protein [Polaribacter litorisediminis]|uniref:DUF6175 family protein n=1 Tax=Polaribacter litorisediminis TaxID=1908341 RepID=UPI001CBA8C5F|nr:DUF6175 family protein [Polaribacter litorisediminis]UAM99724.1 DUF6175 family protein [Polaribacter litorisediminis]